jgi:curved DNA-binding protein CbpA
LTEFKQKALKFHPDKNKDDPSSGEKFAKLQRAKEVLTNPGMRTKYDAWRRSGLLVPFDLWLSRQMSPVSEVYSYNSQVQ